MSALRPLPARPNLEFEHKEAKAFLRQLRAGDPDALARAHAQHPALDTRAPADIQLADAQLVIAREYGFTSWPKLVRYFGDVERQRHNDRYPQDPETYENSARWMLAQHRQRLPQAARALATYVPRLYGMRVDDVFATAVTEDEARLAVARRNGFPSWAALVERCSAEASLRRSNLEVRPAQRASRAMEAGDLAELQKVVSVNPELLQPTEYEKGVGRTLLRSALLHERTRGREAMRPIVEWLVSQGFDLQDELNRMLCGNMRMETETVRWLLDRGADPAWVAPTGIPVLEIALMRYWNGEAADLIAARTVPRKALWIAAALGDVAGVRDSLDAHGKPTPTARELRPDFVVGSPAGWPMYPEADDEEILMEAFAVAMFNGRTATLEYMVSRGVKVDSLYFGAPAIAFAVGNAWVPVVECLVKCGANLDLRGSESQTAREMAREFFEERPEAPGRRRIVELLGMDPDAIIAERDARPLVPPDVSPRVLQALELAGDDAARLGRPDIRPDSLLFGLMRSDAVSPDDLVQLGRMDRMQLDPFRADVKARVLPAEDRIEHPKLPLDADSQAALQAAIAHATGHSYGIVMGLHLLLALTSTSEGVVADLLARYGSSAATVHANVAKGL